MIVMNDERLQISWRPTIRKADGPLYLAIADAIAADIADGRLVDGIRLPPQRVLAEALGIDFTTVSRAYNEARHRGLVEGRVGQGTYVKARRATNARPATSGIVDMSMNLPPLFDDQALAAKLWDDMASLQAEHGLDLLMRYQAPAGTAHNRAAGAAWLRPRLGEVPVERVLICPVHKARCLQRSPAWQSQATPYVPRPLPTPASGPWPPISASRCWGSPSTRKALYQKPLMSYVQREH